MGVVSRFPRPDLNPRAANEYNGVMRLIANIRLFPTGVWQAAVVLAVCGLALAAQGQTENPLPQAPPKNLSGAKVAQNLPVVDLDGYKRLLVDRRGKPLLVTFWATWCEPCRDEYPLVVQLAKDYAPKGLVVLGVDMDDDAELNLAQRFMVRNQPLFFNVRKKMGHTDEFWNGVDPRWKGTMPANFFYAANGQLVGFMTGGRPRPDFEKMIQATLAASPQAASHP